MGYPVCDICSKSCRGDTIKFEQKHYHIGCFKCDKCSILLANCPFFCLNGCYLCIHDYLNLYGERCHACQRYIEGEYVRALNRVYHKNCFICSKCKVQLDDGYVLQNCDDIICQKCRLSFQNGVDCWSCRKKIEDYPIITIFNYQWHSKCFKCGICQRSLSFNNYTFFNQHIYCNSDFYRFVAYKCHQCHKPIITNYLETDNNVGSNEQDQPNVLRFHHKCVKCCKCLEPIMGGQQIYYKSPDLWHIECDRHYQESLDRRNSEVSELQFSTPTTGNSNNSSLNKTKLNNTPKQYSYLHHQHYLQRPLGPKSPNPPHYHIPPSTRTISTVIKDNGNNYEKFENFKIYNNKQNNDYLADLEKLAVVANKWSNQSKKQESANVITDETRGRCNDNSNNLPKNNNNNGDKYVKNDKNKPKWLKIFHGICQFRR